MSDVPLIVHCVAGQRGNFMAWLATMAYTFDERECDVYVWGLGPQTAAAMADLVFTRGWTDLRHAEASMLAYRCEEGKRP